MSSQPLGSPLSDFTSAGRLVVSMVVLLGGCLGPGVGEMLTPFDFETDPNGDPGLASARLVTWQGDTAVVRGGISVDRANLTYVLAFLPGGELVGNSLPPASETDVFSLGWLDAGDRITVTYSSLAERIATATPIGQSDALQAGLLYAFALVDSDSRIVGGPAASPVVVPADGQYYIVVQTGLEDAQVPFDYSFTVTRQPGHGPTPHRGVLLLKFDGAEDLDIALAGETVNDVVLIEDLPPFDLEQARADLAGQADRFKQIVRMIVEYIYADYDVLVTLDPAEARVQGRYDTVVFTSVSGTDLGLSYTPLGIEPKIDVEDTDGQVGIIFIQSHTERRLAMDFNAFCAYWANVAAHEYGHALGLVHVEQVSEALMTARICGASVDCGRGIKELTAARIVGSAFLMQDPQVYLSRVLGRRDLDQAAAIRQGVEELFSE